jgi:hypothetical protein
MILAGDITPEMKDDYIEGLLDGRDPAVVARELDSTGTQFRRLTNPESVHFDSAFADRVSAAKGSPHRKDNREAILDGLIWAAAEKGEKWAIEKLLLVYHDDFDKLRHSNLKISGSIEHTARMLMPHMTTEEIFARLEERGFTREEIEAELAKVKSDREPMALPPPRAA